MHMVLQLNLVWLAYTEHVCFICKQQDAAEENIKEMEHQHGHFIN